VIECHTQQNRSFRWETRNHIVHFTYHRILIKLVFEVFSFLSSHAEVCHLVTTAPAILRGCTAKLAKICNEVFRSYRLLKIPRWSSQSRGIDPSLIAFRLDMRANIHSANFSIEAAMKLAHPMYMPFAKGTTQPPTGQRSAHIQLQGLGGVKKVLVCGEWKM